MNSSNILHVNLCDQEQEPSDDALAQMMDCVAEEANMQNKKASMMLKDTLEQEITALIAGYKSHVKSS